MALVDNDHLWAVTGLKLLLLFLANVKPSSMHAGNVYPGGVLLPVIPERGYGRNDLPVVNAATEHVLQLGDCIVHESTRCQVEATEVVHASPGLNSLQVKFLDLLANHIGRSGSVTLDDLYKAPFTMLDAAGLDGVFPAPLDKELFTVIAPYTPTEAHEGDKPA